MTEQRKRADDFIKALQSAEVAMDALDQCSGREFDIQGAAHACYEQMERELKSQVVSWNDDDEELQVRRCAHAEPGYDAGDKCDVWFIASDSHGMHCARCFERAVEAQAHDPLQK